MFITNQFFNIPGYGDISQLPKEAARLTERLLTSSALPNESKVQYVARKIFEAIGSFFIVLPLLPALPFLLIGYAIHQSAQPSDQYVIGGSEVSLTSKDVLNHLHKIEESKREFSSIEIVHDGEDPLILEDDVLNALKGLHPKNIVLKNVELSPENLESLETIKHYYVVTADIIQGTVHHVLTLKEKISQVILPIDYDEMLETLKEISDKNQRIVNVYFTRPVPHHMEQAVKACMKKIKPTTQNWILDAANRSPQSLAAVIKA
jgi:hypothetical protein